MTVNLAHRPQHAHSGAWFGDQLELPGSAPRNPEHKRHTRQSACRHLYGQHQWLKAGRRNVPIVKRDCATSELQGTAAIDSSATVAIPASEARANFSMGASGLFGSAPPTSSHQPLEKMAQPKNFAQAIGIRKLVGIAILVSVAFIFAWTGVYSVPAESEGVVMRFGRFSNIVTPGLHFKLPFAVDVLNIVPVKRQLKQEFGFGTPGLSAYGGMAVNW